MNSHQPEHTTGTAPTFHGGSLPPHSRRVLVGVDGSEDGLRAVRYGSHSVLGDGGLLHLVHVVDDAVLAGAWGVVYDPATLQEAGQEAIDDAVRLAAELGLSPGQVHGDVVLGNASAVLARVSEGADLLVVGRRAASGLERMFVGSTSLALAGGAHCPVVVISAAANPGTTGGRRQVTVGVDPHAHPEATLARAVAEAAARQVPLGVLHVVDAAHQRAGGDPLAAAAREGIEAALQPALRVHPEVSATVEVRTGNPVDELVAASGQADLLVLGVTGPGLLGLRWGGVMRAVLAHAQSPVLLVR